MDGCVALHGNGPAGGVYEVIALGHEPVVLPADPEPEPYQYVSSAFLGGCLTGRTRSQEGPQGPEHVKVEDQAERFAFALRRKARDRAREDQHSDAPLLDRLYKAL